MLETGTAIGGTKPVLVIIDEIDGATGGSDNVSNAELRIQVLIMVPQNAGFVHKLIGLTFTKSKKGTHCP